MDTNPIEFEAEIDEVKVKNLVSGDKEVTIKIKTPNEVALQLHRFISVETVMIQVKPL